MPSPVEDRARGALLGLAVGDALGTTLEFEKRDIHPLHTEMTGGGPFGLQPGQWTDDMATALALADSLIAHPEFDAVDLMTRLAAWLKKGEYSCTGTCFDVGITTRNAIGLFRRSGNPFAGSEAPDTAGNGSIMRVSPVAIVALNDPALAARLAREQSRTTHAAAEAVEACDLLVLILREAILGRGKDALRPREWEGTRAVQRIARGGWATRDRSQIKSTGYVIDTLEAALWCTSKADNFEEALVLAVNLAGDADTVGAVTGQIAGAVFGASAIPQRWLQPLAWRQRIEETAGRLLDLGSRSARPDGQEDEEAGDGRTLGSPFAAPWMTEDWTLRQRLEALARFRRVFDRDGFAFAEEVPAQHDNSSVTMGWISLGEEAQEFYKVVYDYGWIRAFNWSEWGQSAEGERLLNDPDALAQANEDDLARILTVCIRADRFSEGYLAGSYESGLLGRVVARADVLLGLLRETFARSENDVPRRRTPVA